jgi:hypothetical protein
VVETKERTCGGKSFFADLAEIDLDKNAVYVDCKDLGICESRVIKRIFSENDEYILAIYTKKEDGAAFMIGAYTEGLTWRVIDEEIK